jgi:hypothetical protein
LGDHENSNGLEEYLKHWATLQMKRPTQKKEPRLKFVFPVNTEANEEEKKKASNFILPTQQFFVHKSLGSQK